MATIFDYLKWRGDLLFQERACNEIDNLILSELSYIEMEGIAPDLKSNERISLSEVPEQYLKLGYDQSETLNDPLPLLKAAVNTKRYTGIKLGNYVNKISTQRHLQFSATTFYLDDEHIFVAFRGTDDTLVGWREDFSISYLSETPGQKEAVSYLNKVLEQTDKQVIVGGHSKGGNLAIYASAFCNPDKKALISKVYSNDGPGFNSKVTSLAEYKDNLHKVEMIIPEDSIIGMLLSNKDKKKIIKSSATGGGQHHPYTWLVEGTSFVEADGQSSSGIFWDKVLDQWIEGLNDEEREIFTSSLFDSMEEAGLNTLSDINENKLESYTAVIKAAKKTGNHQAIVDNLMKLAIAGTDTWWNEFKKPFENLFGIKSEENKVEK